MYTEPSEKSIKNNSSFVEIKLFKMELCDYIENYKDPTGVKEILLDLLNINEEKCNIYIVTMQFIINLRPVKKKIIF